MLITIKKIKGRTVPHCQIISASLLFGADPQLQADGDFPGKIYDTKNMWVQKCVVASRNHKLLSKNQYKRAKSEKHCSLCCSPIRGDVKLRSWLCRITVRQLSNSSALAPFLFRSFHSASPNSFLEEIKNKYSL